MQARIVLDLEAAARVIGVIRVDFVELDLDGETLENG